MMYAQASEIICDRPTDRERNSPTGRLGQRHGALTGNGSEDIVSQFWQL